MKTVVIGDIHGRSSRKLIDYIENPDRVIFLGDYFDSHDINPEEQVNNFLDIVEYKKSSGKEVVMLIGNHCVHYFPEIGNTGTSGYQSIARYMIEPVIDANREHLQMAYRFDDYLFTHAGVSQVYMDKVFGDLWGPDDIVDLLNEKFKYQPRYFLFGEMIPDEVYTDPYGDDQRQSPIWIRPRSLMKANAELKYKVIQIVGHTQQNQIDIKGKSTGGRYYFIDTLGTSGEYLIIEDGEVKVGSIK